MSFIPEIKLRAMNFKKLGENVKISAKASIYYPESIQIGDDSRIDDFCVISGNVTIERNVHIAVFSNVAGGEPGITLKDFSGLAYGCQVFAQSDDYSGRSLTNPTVPDLYKKEVKREVIIGRHAIIGANSVVFPGVVVADGTAVGALSMLTKSTEEWSVYFGSPAKRIRRRDRHILELEKEYRTNNGTVK